MDSNYRELLSKAIFHSAVLTEDDVLYDDEVYIDMVDDLVDHILTML